MFGFNNKKYLIKDLKGDKVVLSKKEYDKLKLSDSILNTIESIVIAYFIYKTFNK